VDRRLIWFVGRFAPVLAWPWAHPHDRFTGWLESAPIVPVAFFGRLRDRSRTKLLARR